MNFELHTIESAPDAVKAELTVAENTYGSIPNLYRGLATAPAALKTYLSFNTTLAEFAFLTPVECQVVYLSVSAENECTYCVGAHSVLASMAKMPENILTELREQRPLSDPKLNALRNFALAEIEHRGWVPEQAINDFTEAGYDQRHILEVITILAQKTMSNYYNHIAQTPLDEMFKTMEWQPVNS